MHVFKTFKCGLSLILFLSFYIDILWCRLIARLSRAENTAKRKMCNDLQQTLKPCKQKATVIAAHVSHQFYADQVSILPAIVSLWSIIMKIVQLFIEFPHKAL